MALVSKKEKEKKKVDRSWIGRPELKLLLVQLVDLLTFMKIVLEYRGEQVSDSIMVDATDKGNIARLINHSVAVFGLAKLALDANTHVTTRVMGTFGLALC